MGPSHNPRCNPATRTTANLPRIQFYSPCNRISPARIRPLYGLCPAVPHDCSTYPSVGRMVTYMHSVHTQANAIKFSHQLLCNLKKSSLMKALRKGFLKECPNHNQELVTKYLNLSPATAKDHMKQPKKGIRSMGRNTPKKDDIVINTKKPVPLVTPIVLPIFVEPPPYHGPAYGAQNDAILLSTTNQLQMLFVLVPLQIRYGVLYITTSPAISPLCPSTEASASLSCTTTKQMPSWSKQLKTSMTTAFMKHTKSYLKHWKQRDTHPK
jgi:hypothetical protein